MCGRKADWVNIEITLFLYMFINISSCLNMAMLDNQSHKVVIYLPFTVYINHSST